MPRYIVTYKTGSQQKRRLHQKKHHCKRIHRLRVMVDTLKDIEIIESESEEFVQQLPDVLKITPDVEVQAIGTVPDDTFYSVQYAHPMINSPSAWDHQTDASSVVVAIVDTGIDLDHEDLIDNLWVDPNESNPLFKHGRAFTSYTSSPNDDNGHGTHCAGIIGAMGNNGQGVCGCAWRVKLMAVKFLSSQGGGYLSDALRGLDYAIQKGANIISNSWGGGAWDTDAIDDVFNEAKNKGILIVCAAGNGAMNHDNAWFKIIPADSPVDNNISVAANDESDALTWWSDYGMNSIKVAAPGNAIGSTYPDDRYVYMSGTSMACPCVSGVAALFMARFGKNYAVTRDHILWTSTTSVNYSDKVVTGGRVDVGRMFSYPLGGSHPIGLERLYDVLVEEDGEEELQNNISWTLPSGATGAVICAQDGFYPQNVTDSVIYSSSGTSCIDTVTDRDTPRYYSCWAVYGLQYSLPVRYRHGEYEPFSCPLPPPGYDFICNFFEEQNLSYIELLSSGVYAQLWRGISSKFRTFYYGYAGGEAEYPVDPFESGSGPIMYDGYDLESETEPLASDVMNYQNRGHVGKFIWNCFHTLNEIRNGATLYSPIFDKEMKWAWLNYWLYRKTGEVRGYSYPVLFDVVFGEGDMSKYEAYFVDPANWKMLVKCLRTVIYNLRVLFCSEIPWFTTPIKVTGKSAKMDSVVPEFSDDFLWWAPISKRPKEDPGLLPPDWIRHDVDGVAVWKKGTGLTPYFDGDICPEPNYVGSPIEIMFVQSWGSSSRYFMPYTNPAYGTGRRPLSRFANISYDTNYAPFTFESSVITPPAFNPGNSAWKYRGHAGFGYWYESPTGLDKWIENFGSLCTFTYKGAEFHFIDHLNCESLRGILEQDFRVHFPAEYDWVSLPVRVTVTLRLEFAQPLSQENFFPLLPFAKDAGVECLPQEDETGYAELQLTGDLSGSYEINPTTMWKDGPTEIVVGTFDLDTAGPHTKDLGITIDFGLTTLPHVVREFITFHGGGERRGIPPLVYELKTYGTKWVLTPYPIDYSEYPNISWEGGWLMNRWGGFSATLLLSAEVIT